MLIEQMPYLLVVNSVIAFYMPETIGEQAALRREACHLPLMSNHSISKVGGTTMIRKLKSGEYRLYSRKADPKTGKRRNLGTFPTREKAEKHERAVQYFKHH